MLQLLLLNQAGGKSCLPLPMKGCVQRMKLPQGMQQSCLCRRRRLRWTQKTTAAITAPCAVWPLAVHYNTADGVLVKQSQRVDRKLSWSAGLTGIS